MARSSTRSSKRSSDRAESSPARLERLGRGFFARETVQVAKDLLGKLLEVRSPSGSAIGRIVETEAYAGDDPGSHWHRGETPRCSIVFGEPGRAYVYFIYGSYEMLNIVTEASGRPGAVLIRALEPVEGVERMRRRRKVASDRDLCNGPGKLCRALGVRMSDNGAFVDGSRIRVLSDGYRPKRILASPRIGLKRGAETPWRFFIEADAHVSKSPFNRAAVEAR